MAKKQQDYKKLYEQHLELNKALAGALAVELKYWQDEYEESKAMLSGSGDELSEREIYINSMFAANERMLAITKVIDLKSLTAPQ